MWYGQRPPWMQRELTPGAGMPPGGHAPMSMQRPQIPTPHVAPSNVPLVPAQSQDQQGGLPSPALLGVLSRLFGPQQSPLQKLGGPENRPDPARPPLPSAPLPVDMMQRVGGPENVPGAGEYGFLRWLGL